MDCPFAAADEQHMFGRSASSVLLGRGFKYAYGCRAYDLECRPYLDFTAGVGVMSTGHRHPGVVSAVHAQLDRFVAYHDAPSDARARLLGRLASLLPGYRFALFSGGSETVEAAIRVARHYTGVKDILGLEDGFHGKTLAASVAAGRIEKKIGSLRGERPAAVIVEICQGTAGNVPVPEPFLEYARGFCRQHGALFISDEILMGCGRTGKMFAHDHFPELSPDMVLLGKGIASGFPFGVLAVKDYIASDPRVDIPSAFSTSFGGNALGCAAADATLRVIEEENLVARAYEMGQCLAAQLRDAMKYHKAWIEGIHGMGLAIGLKFRDFPTDGIDFAARLVRNCADAGLLLMKGKWNTVRINPSLVISEAEIDEGVDILKEQLGRL